MIPRSVLTEQYTEAKLSGMYRTEITNPKHRCWISVWPDVFRYASMLRFFNFVAISKWELKTVNVAQKLAGSVFGTCPTITVLSVSAGESGMSRRQKYNL